MKEKTRTEAIDWLRSLKKEGVHHERLEILKGIELIVRMLLEKEGM